MAKKKVSKADKLKALRAKLDKTDMGGNRGFWTPPQGTTEIRILPEVGDMDYFFQEVGRHYLPEKKTVYCPSFTSEGDLDCPICDFVQDLYSLNDAASKDMASKIRVRKQYWMNICVRENGNTSGPFIYTPGITVFQSLAGFINDPDYGDIFDLEDGTDVSIERSGTGLETTYQVIPRRKTSPLAASAAQANEILKQARDLSWVEVDEDPELDKELADGHAVYLLPYDRIVLENELGGDVEDLLEEMEDEEDHPVKKDVRRRRRSRR